jgi:polyisoprenoid-binding protein YceI
VFKQAIGLGLACVAITAAPCARSAEHPVSSSTIEQPVGSSRFEPAVWSEPQPQAYSIEPAHTVVTFQVSNLGIAKRRGVFNAVAGKVLLDPATGEGSVDIVVNAESVQAGDRATQTFVRGESFLNVDKYSEITYRADHVVFAGTKPTRVEGQLTLLGVTRTVPLTVSGYRCDDQQCVLDAVATFRRSEFGMNHYLALVSDNVRLEIHSALR